MIKLTNGAKVLEFTGCQAYDGSWSGVVLAESMVEYVTWRVTWFPGQETWDAYSGNYHCPGDLGKAALQIAYNDYVARR